MEHDERAEELERAAEDMDERSERVGEHIEETRADWEAKESDPTVPGAQPDDAEEEESVPGVAGDEDIYREEPGP